MPVFHFKFDAVLRQRELAEEACQRDLAQHLRKRMILHDQLRNMQRTIEGSKRELGSALVGQVDLARIGDFARYSGVVTTRAYQIVARLGELEKQIATARVRLADAARQRKVMELLRDRHRAEWQAEQNRIETLEMDELATQQYARSLMAGGAE